MAFTRIHIYTIAALFTFSAASCKKILDVVPKDQVLDESTITDQASAETALRGAYRSLADNNYYGRTFQFAIYLQGGDLGWGDSRTVNLQFIQNDVRADNEEVQNVWSAIYKTINRANHVIAKVPGVNDPVLKQEYRNQLLGEAHFIRALAYFDLARTWGGVQLKLTPTDDISNLPDVKRSSLDETYAQIIKDLETAEKYLPDNVNRVRATQKTVRALRARLHLYRQEWTLAENYASKVIGDPGFRLIKPYSSFFANNVVNTQESILETAYSASNTNSHRSAWQPTENGGIRSWFPDDEFVKLVNDSTIGGNRKTLIAKAKNGQWYGNLYYRRPATDPAYILRIAEQYLIRAEARANLGNTSGALQDLNSVRDRAGLPPSTAITQEEILLAIENERRFEFAFEPHRWYDLVRTGRAQSVLGIKDKNKGLLPIPVKELLVDKNLNQNPGY
jgi:starch-binding outer membrane protein, SusD/RagB family